MLYIVRRREKWMTMDDWGYPQQETSTRSSSLWMKGKYCDAVQFWPLCRKTHETTKEQLRNVGFSWV